MPTTQGLRRNEMDAWRHNVSVPTTSLPPSLPPSIKRLRPCACLVLMCGILALPLINLAVCPLVDGSRRVRSLCV